MSNKGFMILLAAIVIGAVGFIVVNQKSKPKEVIIGVQHADQGQDHIALGQKHKAYNSEPASSGPHRNDVGAPTPWGVYTEELTPEVYVHNEEHGGVIFTYNPTLLSPADLKKLQALFVPPYSNKNFTPSKALVFPRAADTHAIQAAAWTYTLSLDHYDEATLMKFYLQRVGQSPEPSAGPNNTPINQAATTPATP